MNKNVMKYVLNYYEVINFIYDEKDFVTDKIIKYYKNYFINENNTNKLRSLDEIVSAYINDDNFNIYVKGHINDFYTDEYGIDYYYDMDKILSKLFKNYQKFKERSLVTSVWL